MSAVKHFYERLPRAGQTLALNIFGLRNRRRAAIWRRYLAGIEWTERMPRDEQIAYTAERLREILLHAVKTVPHYSSHSALTERLSDPSEDVYGILTDFPVVTKADVLEAPRSFISSDPGPGKVVKAVTSGTTGTPFATWMGLEAFNRGDALWWRRNLWNGYREGEWVARIVGDPAVPIGEKWARRPWRVSWTDRRLYLSTFHLRADTAMSYVDVLERRRPEYIQGYPSSLEILSRFCIEAGRELRWRPKAVLFSSEPMFEHQREAISKVFRAPIIGLYGSAERIISAAECEAGTYHLSLVDGYVEGQFGVLEPGSPALVTTLMNRAMPLIRFRLGDVIELEPDTECPCGRTLPVMAPVVTKHEDWVETPSGRRVSASGLTWAFKDLEGIRRSQIVQTGPGTVVVHVDGDEETVAEVTPPLVERLGRMFFGEIDVSVVRDTDIRMLESGKTRFVVREKW